MTNIANGNGPGGNRPSFTDTKKTDFVKVITNFASQEPYLFFCPDDPRTTLISATFPFARYYKYLVCNSGFGNSKKAIFYNSNAERIDIHDIKDISILHKLRDFILEQRTHDPTFCKTILTAVEQELERRK